MAEHGIPPRTRGILEMRARTSYAARQLVLPVQAFIHTAGRSSTILLLAAIVALVWANSPWADSYFALWQAYLSFDLGIISLSHSLRHWVNDGLMVLFFFVVGLEIKREIVHGELSSLRRAALPVTAAVGGMVIPALIYAALNLGGPAISGWGIPMATDIAFALGIVALLGRRIPSEVRLFLLAVAIADDIGAILVIALFYSGELATTPLLLGLVLIGAIVLMKRLAVTNIGAYVLPGFLLWLAVHESGIHATIAGVVLALLTPAAAYFSPESFQEAAGHLLERYRGSIERGEDQEAHAVLGELEELTLLTESPVERLERRVYPGVAYVILPIFALANAGVAVTPDAVVEAFSGPVALGIALGLLIGKPIGILLFAWLSVVLRFGELPSRVRWSHIGGAGALAGIGFTVSLFIAGLAFQDPAVMDRAKIGILGGSLVAGVLGYFLLRRSATAPEAPGEPVTSS